MKTMFFILVVSFCASLGADTLVFDASPTPNVTYVMRWGPNASGTIGLQNLGTNLFMSLTNGPWGTNYFQVNAVSTNGVEGFGSNVLLATNRPEAPLRLRIVLGTNIVFLDGSSDGMLTWQRLAMIVKDPVVLAAKSNQLFRALKFPPLPPP